MERDKDEKEEKEEKIKRAAKALKYLINESKRFEISDSAAEAWAEIILFAIEKE